MCTTDATITIVPGTNFNPESELITISWTLNGVSLAETGLTVPVTGPGVYKATVDNWGCENAHSVNVTQTTVPVVDVLNDVTACEVYILPVLINPGNRYFDAAGGPEGTGIELFAGDDILETSTIWIFAESGTSPENCTAESSFVVTIGEIPVFNLGGPYVVCDPNITIEVKDAGFNTETANYVWRRDGTEIGQNAPFLEVTEFDTYEVTVTTLEGCVDTQSVVVSADTNPIALELTQGCDNGVYKINVAPDNNSYDPDTVQISWTGPNGFTSSDALTAVEAVGVYNNCYYY